MRTAITTRTGTVMLTDASFEPRPTCYRCFRPTVVCYCDVVQQIDCRTRVVIVQHPREVFHPLNTARLAERCLRKVDVLRGDLPDLDAAFRALRLPARAALLFPSKDAVDVGELAEEQKPECLVVIDGTWNQARVLNRRLPSLATLPRIRFTPTSPSEYRIRREPRADYLSTVESIALVLSHLEPERSELELLRQTFRTMIDRNVAARSTSRAAPRQKRAAVRRAPDVPNRLLGPAEGIVLLYAEAAPDPAKAHGKHPFVVHARRLGASPTAGGEELRAVLATPFVPHAIAREAHALSEEELRGAIGREELLRKVRAFVRSGDVVVAWNESSHEVLEEALGEPLERLGLSTVCLKGAYCNLRGRDVRRESLRRGAEGRTAWGSLGDIARREGLTPTATGRAARRLEETTFVVSVLRRLAASAG